MENFNDYFLKTIEINGGIEYYSIDIDTEEGSNIRDLQFKSYNKAKKTYDKYKKKMMYDGELISDIQLIAQYKNGQYDSIN